MTEYQPTSHLTTQQVNFLLQPVDQWRVGHTQGRSHMMSYDIRAHLNRVFGFGNWSGEALRMELVSEIDHLNSKNKPAVTVTYRCQYRLTVRSTDGTELATYTEWAVGTASGIPQSSRGDAHDQAIKTAESQALKRCAINLGDQFGLSLYNAGSMNALVQITCMGDAVETPEVAAQTLAAEEDPDTAANLAAQTEAEGSQVDPRGDAEQPAQVYEGEVLTTDQWREDYKKAMSQGPEVFARFCRRAFQLDAPDAVLDALPKTMEDLNEKARKQGRMDLVVEVPFATLRRSVRR